MKKKKSYAVIARYIGSWHELRDWGIWYRWGRFRDEAAANMAKDALTRNHGQRYEFRVVPSDFDIRAENKRTKDAV